jgi:inorganic phosphate transporter, PiT family
VGELFIVGIVVAFGLAFDFTNGFHDTANAMATSIATGALRPKVAVAVSGALNFIGAFLSLSVAATIASGIVNGTAIHTSTVFAGLIGAITWNLLTWLLGLPSSSSHAIVGGTVGAVFVQAGSQAIKWDGILSKVLIPALASPIIAGVATALAVFIALRITARARPSFVQRGYRLGQVASASLVSLAHGTNDAQKTMGIITLALIASGTIGAQSGVPAWVIVTCAAAIATGTYIGGWRVIRTLGKGLTEITSPQGFSSESVASAVILGAAHFGFAVSTTQVVSGAVMGAGIGKGARVRWPVAAQMVTAWLLTIPLAALFGGAAEGLNGGIGGVTGVAVTAAVALLVFTAIYLAAQRRPINAKNVNYPIPDGSRTALNLQPVADS